MSSRHSHSDKSDFPKLAQPAQRALAQAGYSRLDQLASVKTSEIKKLHGIGPNAIEQLHLALHARELAFANEKPEQP